MRPAKRRKIRKPSQKQFVFQINKVATSPKKTPAKKSHEVSTRGSPNKNSPRLEKNSTNTTLKPLEAVEFPDSRNLANNDKSKIESVKTVFAKTIPENATDISSKHLTWKVKNSESSLSKRAREPNHNDSEDCTIPEISNNNSKLSRLSKSFTTALKNTPVKFLSITPKLSSDKDSSQHVKSSRTKNVEVDHESTDDELVLVKSVTNSIKNTPTKSTSINPKLSSNKDPSQHVKSSGTKNVEVDHESTDDESVTYSIKNTPTKSTSINSKLSPKKISSPNVKNPGTRNTEVDHESMDDELLLVKSVPNSFRNTPAKSTNNTQTVSSNKYASQRVQDSDKKNLEVDPESTDDEFVLVKSVTNSMKNTPTNSTSINPKLSSNKDPSQHVKSSDKKNQEVDPESSDDELVLVKSVTNSIKNTPTKSTSINPKLSSDKNPSQHVKSSGTKNVVVDHESTDDELVLVKSVTKSSKNTSTKSTSINPKLSPNKNSSHYVKGPGKRNTKLDHESTDDEFLLTKPISSKETQPKRNKSSQHAKQKQLKRTKPSRTVQRSKKRKASSDSSALEAILEIMIAVKDDLNDELDENTSQILESYVKLVETEMMKTIGNVRKYKNNEAYIKTLIEENKEISDQIQNERESQLLKYEMEIELKTKEAQNDKDLIGEFLKTF